MNLFLQAWQARYDGYTYSRDEYYRSIEEASEARNADELSEPIIRMLHWKDGKVFPTRPKPNIYSPGRHGIVLRSQDFFEWGEGIRRETQFVSSSITVITERFRLWDSVVMPVLVLHVLNPLVYPLYDRYVQKAKQGLLAEGLHEQKPTVDSYSAYRDFFVSLANTRDIRSAKFVDEALWSFGKWLTSLSSATSEVESDTQGHDRPTSATNKTGAASGSTNADKLFAHLCQVVRAKGTGANTYTVGQIAEMIPRGTAGVDNHATYGFSIMSMLSGQNGRDYFVFENPMVRDEFTAACRNGRYPYCKVYIGRHTAFP